MTQIVTTSCNQCEQRAHDRCPAESLVRQGFFDNAGDHCQCAYDGHKTPQTEKKVPRIKSMLGAQKQERDVPTNTIVSEEVEVD